MQRRYFGTDGVRGPYGGPLINAPFAARLAAAAARWAAPAGVGRVLIGRDSRASGSVLASAVAAGVRSQGLDAVSLGVLPTPAVAHALRASGDVLGVMLTASHNPAADNGIKFFGPGGTKLTDAQEAAIESLLGDDLPGPFPTLPDKTDGTDAYRAAAAALLPSDCLSGWRLVVDTAHGATVATTPAVLRQLGAEVVALGDAPDGTNINAGVGSEHPERLAATVRATGARLGVAHDGDGDRLVLCDETGALLDGDSVLTLLATHALAHGRLARHTLVVTQQSNLGVDAAVSAAGGRVVRTAIGDRYVLERMHAEGATLGGESSGHLICAEVSPTGDGLVAALKVLEVMLATGRPLSELGRVLRRFPQATSAFTVREKRPLESLPRVADAIRSLEQTLGRQGRVLVRYSGTEPKLRLLVEGPTAALVQSGLAALDAAARADLDVV